MAEFGLDPAFGTTAATVGDLPLCHVRLQLDARYPWLVLIRRRPGLRELEDLSPADRAVLTEELVLAGVAVRAVGAVLGLAVDKLNLGLLGNVTPQLHAHVVGRRAGDPAWPGPVWGHSPATAYPVEALDRALTEARRVLGV